MPKISHVKLLKKIKISTSAGANWTLVPALFDSKGRLRRDHVTVAGRDESTPKVAITSNGGNVAVGIAKPLGQMASPPPTKYGLSRPNWTPYATGLFQQRQMSK